MTRTFSPIERRGLEVVAQAELELERRCTGKLLVYLLEHPDHTWPYEQLASVGMVNSRRPMSRGYCIRCLQRARESLVDVGFDRSAIICEPSIGYRMAAGAAREVLAWLEARA